MSELTYIVRKQTTTGSFDQEITTTFVESTDEWWMLDEADEARLNHAEGIIGTDYKGNMTLPDEIAETVENGDTFTHDELLALFEEDEEDEDETEATLTHEVEETGEEGSDETHALTARVTVTDTATDESATYQLRNAVDVGFQTTALDEVSDEFDTAAQEYLRTHSPIYTGHRQSPRDGILMTDGGVDTSSHFTDEEIVAAINQQDDPEHDDSNSVADIRELLGHMQESVEVMWSEWMDNIENGDTMLVYEDDDCIIVSTGEYRMYDQELSTYEGDVETDDIAMSTVSQVHHNIAKRLTDYNWGYSYPFVIAKPDDCNAGERLVEAHLMWLMDECDLSGGVALDYYMVEWRGLSQSKWSKRAGKDQGTVSQNIKNAKEHVVR